MTPGAAWTIAFMVRSDFGSFKKEHFFFQAITDVRQELERLNSAANFVVYVALSQQFRGTLLEILRCPKSCRDSQMESHIKGEDTAQTDVTDAK